MRPTFDTTAQCSMRQLRQRSFFRLTKQPPLVPCCSLPPPSSSTSNPEKESLQAAAPDLVLPAPPGGADICIFGALHGDPEGWEIGEFILQERPHTLVAETAINAAHGSGFGNVASLDDCLQITGNDARTRALAHVGVQLQAFPFPAVSTLWQEVSRSPMFFSEHLAYIAAFAVGAKLVHGDRPKHITYQRLLWQPSLLDLDRAFGLQSAMNYHDMAPNMRAPVQDGPSAATITEQVLLLERDAMLLQSLHEASLEAGEGAKVVGVVGASHLTGMQRLWEDGSWREIASGATSLPERMGEEETPQAVGVRRALFDGIIRLICRSDVTLDIEDTLGPPPAEAAEVHALTHELYGSCRMLLACLDEDQLKEVCQGWRVNMWEVLQPLRDVRPVNGGPGYDRELIVQLRELNYDIS